jgi:CSLREA domain-containing protein
MASVGSRAAGGLAWLVVIGALAVCVVAAATPVEADSTITVTTTADELTTNGNCSLREAIRAANLDQPVDACSAGSGADTIALPAGIYVLSMVGSDEDAGLTGDLDITSDLTITGAGADRTIIDGNMADRVIDLGVPGVQTGFVVRFSGITIRNGLGSGIRNSSSVLTLEDSTVSDNHGPGIFTEDFLALTRSVVTGNTGEGVVNNGIDATAVLSESTITGNLGQIAVSTTHGSGLSVVNSTISGNSGGAVNAQGSRVTVTSSTVVRNGAGIRVVGEGSAGGTLTMSNTILAGNGGDQGCTLIDLSLAVLHFNLIQNDAGCDTDLSGEPVELMGNVVGVDPILGPLQDNGGRTPTHALLSGSPAIDAGDPATPGSSSTACPTTDQRGVARPQDGNGDGLAICDIGAFELRRPATPPPNAIPPSGRAP